MSNLRRNFKNTCFFCFYIFKDDVGRGEFNIRVKGPGLVCPCGP